MAPPSPTKSTVERYSTQPETDLEQVHEDSLVGELEVGRRRKLSKNAGLYFLVLLALSGILCLFFGPISIQGITSPGESNDEIIFLPNTNGNIDESSDYPLLDSRSGLSNFNYRNNTFLTNGESIEQGSRIKIQSGNMEYHLQQQSDGNLVLLDEEQNVYWSSGVSQSRSNSSKRYWTLLQSDGNLVTYSRVNNVTINVEWASDTKSNRTNYNLVLSPGRDGLMIAQREYGKITWYSKISPSETVFYAIGDVPYREIEKTQLEDRMKELPFDAEFVIHLGDIRDAEESKNCKIEEYQEVHNILRHSSVPVFIIPGDNEWGDCKNSADAKRYWRDTFHKFDENWDHTFPVRRHPTEPENFAFVHKRTLYFGLAILGGNNLSAKFEFVKDMIDRHVVEGDAGNVVIFGHAFPTSQHDRFFDPLQEYIRSRLRNKVPILYLNGDYHFYESETKYMGFSNFNRLQVAQGTREPPLKVAVAASTSPNWSANQAFSHDRMLWLSL